MEIKEEEKLVSKKRRNSQIYGFLLALFDTMKEHCRNKHTHIKYGMNKYLNPGYDDGGEHFYIIFT